MSSVHECPGCGYQYNQDLGDEHEGFARAPRLTSYR